MHTARNAGVFVLCIALLLSFSSFLSLYLGRMQNMRLGIIWEKALEEFIYHHLFFESLEAYFGSGHCKESRFILYFQHFKRNEIIAVIRFVYSYP